MAKYLNLAHIIVSVLLVVAILLQSRGSGLSSLFGGGGEFYQTRRGLEKKIFILTIILAIIFLALGVIRLVI
ncbi:MAG: preprotein translocase subunit SecG [Patescibacteria group bacterium]